MKKATITTVLQGCKGPQGRTRLAVLIGGVAMLLLLLSELMPTGSTMKRTGISWSGAAHRRSKGSSPGATARPLPSRVKRACRLLSLKRHLQA